jgi:hypothetical protein
VEEAGMDYRSILNLPFEVITVAEGGEIIQHVKPRKFGKDGNPTATYDDDRAENQAPLLESDSKRVQPIAHTASEFELVSSISDRLQKKLNQANETLKLQAEEIKAINGNLKNRNRELQESLDALTKAKASRQATTLVLIIALGLFVLSESIEYYIEQRTEDVLSLPVLLIIKLIIALLLKPVESLLERFILKRSLKNQASNLNSNPAVG